MVTHHDGQFYKVDLEDDECLDPGRYSRLRSPRMGTRTEGCVRRRDFDELCGDVLGYAEWYKGRGCGTCLSG